MAPVGLFKQKSECVSIRSWQKSCHRPASVLTFRNPGLTFARGKADREKGIDNTLNKRFRIGSMNKMFTAVAALQLVECGKLSLDDTIGKILP